MLCTDADWDNLSISVTVDRAQLREFVCDLDYQMIVDDIWRVIDPMGFAADVSL
ncbi:hypothetical protein DPMN_036637 [Dreissena polymorpha]|uniref:Uncharacterized protein n=1 Tax=Dreissena polymorpha TaxID=45954 RepID=A0A9D4MDC4_DREPO|nr:hypothetical protein DPMN_036637 [Dreissena polymorpha]